MKRWTSTAAALALTALLGAAYGGSGGLEPPLASGVALDAATPAARAGLAITRQPLDKSLIEGNTARFDVVTTGTVRAYQWERAPSATAPFVSLAGETAPVLTLASVPLAEDGSLYRVVVSNRARSITSDAATLAVAPVAAAARVYVTEPSAVTTYDTAIATASGAGYTATADIGAGTFAARIKAPNGSVFAGIFQLKLINNTGLPVTIGAGALRAHFDGTYIHPVLPAQSTATTVSAQFGASAAGAGIFTARGDHQVAFTYDPDGNVLSKSNVFRKVYEQNGAKVKVAFAKPSGLIMDLVMPRIVLGAGAALFLNLQLLANTQRGTVDFAATPATLRLTLPPGVTLDNDAAVPLDWVITTP